MGYNETVRSWWKGMWRNWHTRWLEEPCSQERGGSSPPIPTIKMPFTIYVLISSKIPRTYVGYTNNLEKRVEEHNKGKVQATKYFQPWKILYKEITPSEKEAKQRERYWKSGAGRRNLKRILNGFPPRLNSGRGSP